MGAWERFEVPSGAGAFGRMANLQQVLAQVREKILRYRGSSIGEQNTKATLVEPVLRALGWNVEDLEEVSREYKRRNADNPVDYALLVLRTPRLFVETKGLGENLDDRRWASQIMGYAAVAGVEWVVLTDGDEYRIYNSHATVPVEEKLFRAVQITEDQPRVEETLWLLSRERIKEDWIDTLWKAHFVDRKIQATIEGLFNGEPDPSLIRLISRRSPTLSLAEIKAGLSRLRISLDFPFEPVPLSKVGSAGGGRASQERKPLGDKVPQDSAAHGEGTPWRDVSVKDLIHGGFIKPPVKLEKTYLGRTVSARIEPDGRVTCLGVSYNSVSIAAAMARASVSAAPPGRKYPQTNGWIFWRFRDEDGQVKPLDVLRQRYLQANASPALDRRA